MQLTASYQNWKLGFRQQQEGWTFEAIPPSSPKESLSDNVTYPTIEGAIRAAQWLANSRSVRDQISEKLSDLHANRAIDDEQYADFLQLITQLVHPPT